MNTEITELGTTVFTGVLTLAAFYMVLVGFPRVLARVRGLARGVVESWKGEIPTVLLGAFLGTISLGVGMAIEDISDWLVDTRDEAGLTKYLLPDEDLIAAEVIYGDLENPTGTSLGREVARVGAFRLLSKGGGEAERFLLGESNSQLTRDQMEATSRGVYYHAKNVVYRHSTYFSELGKFQNRINLARACTVIPLVLLGLGILLALAERRQPPLSPEDQVPVADTQAIRRAVLVGAILLHAFGQFAFRKEEQQYNRRVFGYYISICVEPIGEEGSKPWPKKK